MRLHVLKTEKLEVLYTSCSRLPEDSGTCASLRSLISLSHALRSLFGFIILENLNSDGLYVRRVT